MQKDFKELGERLKNCRDPSKFPKTVVFCRHKEMVAKLFQFLQHSAKHKESVGMYHASLTEQTKRESTDGSAVQPRSCVAL